MDRSVESGIGDPGQTAVIVLTTVESTEFYAANKPLWSRFGTLISPRHPPILLIMNSGTPASPHRLAALLVAGEAALASLSDLAQAEEAEASLRRAARTLAHAPDVPVELRNAARLVLGSSSPEVAEAAGQLVAALRKVVGSDSAAGLPERILVVEDDTLFARSLENALAGPGRHIVTALTAAEAEERLAEGPVSLLVLDLILPDRDGRNILLELRSDPRTAGIPVFVVTARLGSQTRAECFALGADAYFEKPLDLHAFGVAVTARLERRADQRRPARQDPVTGLANRAAFLETAARLRRSAEPGRAFSLAVLDLDHFRWVEETWGRQFGDTVLRRAGVRLALALRQASCFARWEGAEFIALFAGRSAPEATAALEHALGVLRRVDFRPGQTPPLTLTFSAGVADVAPGQPIEDAIEAADRMCYLAKSHGRGRVIYDDPGSPVPAPRILIVDDDPAIRRLLARYLEREGFEVIAANDGAEALSVAATSGAALIISDVEMPVLDGLALLQRLRELPESRHLPVMMLTAMGDEDHIVRAFDLGVDDYVLKPFSAREVVARVRRLLRRPSVMGVPAAR
jgi:diguanylate cyclase (GGDEF)-like protein